ncbi:MAG: hypothetical protein UX10_C0002G0011 [Candidatus Magasanikbacteria bacterium GW2011_GWA2_45_39]|uniref:Baseplate protein J-like domain-containing protein n=1 Tax=Candidatus Magasanikbacteria bacterium GW2011_GWA2_45_39 TaxID=1619041 RepID=A0A0G1MJ64_9BACT|nr:MAG: hypothetical protein UX10_C0002G0011 [Candidatus Magasanikbacteria bacterium GW2011_GWA2_45_39]HBW74281.1 hypothetical protein [Candidatus Magasanikbacteria bacterium]
MPEDIFAPSKKETEIPIGKSKKPIKRKAPVKRARSKQKASARVSHATHAAAVDAALSAIAHEENPSQDMEIGGNITAFNPSPRFYRTIALSFLAGTIILVVAVSSMTMGKAIITIKTKPQTITFDAPVNIASNLNGENSVKGVVRLVSVSGSKSMSPENGPEQPSYAGGSVTLVNNSKENQPLVATTRFLSKEEILFRLRKSVVVPANGSIAAEVIADKPGKQNEIGPTQFRIPGLSEAKQKLIYAESASGMTGGTSRKAVLTDVDIERATTVITSELLAEGKKQLESAVNASSTNKLMGVFTSNAKEVKNDTKLGAVTEQFTISMKLEVTGVFYSAADLNTHIMQAIQTNTSYAGSTVSPVGQAEMTVNHSDEKTQTADVRVKQEWMVKTQNYDNLIDKRQLGGLTSDDVSRALKGLEWVDSARVAFTPGWIKKVPKNIDKIKIEFAE